MTAVDSSSGYPEDENWMTVMSVCQQNYITCKEERKICLPSQIGPEQQAGLWCSIHQMKDPEKLHSCWSTCTRSWPHSNSSMLIRLFVLSFLKESTHYFSGSPFAAHIWCCNPGLFLPNYNLQSNFNATNALTKHLWLLLSAGSSP